MQPKQFSSLLSFPPTISVLYPHCPPLFPGSSPMALYPSAQCFLLPGSPPAEMNAPCLPVVKTKYRPLQIILFPPVFSAAFSSRSDCAWAKGRMRTDPTGYICWTDSNCFSTDCDTNERWTLHQRSSPFPFNSLILQIKGVLTQSIGFWTFVGLSWWE